MTTTEETMMHPTDYKPYAEALACRKELADALEKSQARHSKLCVELANVSIATGHDYQSPLESAIATARGELTATRSDELLRLRDEEAVLRVAISRLERGLAAATERLNVETQRAQVAAYRAQGEALEKMRKDWMHAVDAMLSALDAEDAMLSGLVSRGFCAGEAVITRPHGAFISRDRLRDTLAVERARLYDLKL